MADTPEITELRAMLQAREGKPGFTENVADIKARLKELGAA